MSAMVMFVLQVVVFVPSLQAVKLVGSSWFLFLFVVGVLC